MVYHCVTCGAALVEADEKQCSSCKHGLTPVVALVLSDQNHQDTEELEQEKDSSSLEGEVINFHDSQQAKLDEPNIISVAAPSSDEKIKNDDDNVDDDLHQGSKSSMILDDRSALVVTTNRPAPFLTVGSEVIRDVGVDVPPPQFIPPVPPAGVVVVSRDGEEENEIHATVAVTAAVYDFAQACGSQQDRSLPMKVNGTCTVSGSFVVPKTIYWRPYFTSVCSINFSEARFVFKITTIHVPMLVFRSRFYVVFPQGVRIELIDRFLKKPKVYGDLIRQNQPFPIVRILCSWSSSSVHVSISNQAPAITVIT